MEPEFVDITALPLVADEQWLLQQVNGNGAGREANTSWEPRNLAELDDKPPIEPTLGGLGLLYPGKRHVFSGPQESAKTLAAYVIGLQVVREGRTVVLIDFEMGPWDAKTRLRELGATDDELGRFLYVEPDVPATPGVIGALVSLEPSLVVLDALAGAFQLEALDDNSRRDVERWAAAWVQPFWRAGIATIVLDHVTKNAETRGNYAIGSERKVGGADVHIGFTVKKEIHRGGDGRYKLTTHKDRGGMLKRGHLCDLVLDSDPETHYISPRFEAPPVVDADHPFRPSVIMERISRFLESCYEPVSKAKIENKDNVKGNTEYKRAALDILSDEGFIEIGPTGIESIKPFRKDEDDLAHTSPNLAQEPVDKHLAHSPLPYRKGEGGANPGGRGDPDERGDVRTDIPF